MKLFSPGTALYEEGVTDGMEHTTLMFTTGPGFNYTWDGEKVRTSTCKVFVFYFLWYLSSVVFVFMSVFMRLQHMNTDVFI